MASTIITRAVAERRDGVALVVLAGTVGVIMSAQASLIIAAPDISRSLSPTATERQWIIDVFPVVLASMLLLAGAIGDRFGRRGMLEAGLAVLAAANVWLALTHTSHGAIGARALAGLGAAMAFPATLATITATFPPERRSRGISVWTSAAVLGSFAGVILAGLLLRSYSWRSIGWVTAALALGALAATRLAVQESRAAERVRIDVVGAVLVTAAVGSLVFAIIESPSHGLGSPLIVGAFALFVVAAVAFIRWEARIAHPLLDVRALTVAPVAVGLVGLVVQFVVIYAYFVLALTFLNRGLGYGPLKSGVALLAFGVPIVGPVAVASWVARHVSRVLTVAIGLLTFAVGAELMALVTAHSTYLEFLGPALIVALGVGITQVPATHAVLDALPASAQGLASAINDVTRELGAALGIAISGAVLAASGDGGATLGGLSRGFRNAYLVLGVIGLVGALSMLFLRRRMVRSAGAVLRGQS